jgi:hypothetical protein
VGLPPRDGLKIEAIEQRFLNLPPLAHHRPNLPSDDGLRLDNRQSVRNVRRKPIEDGKDQTIEIAESQPLREFSS